MRNPPRYYKHDGLIMTLSEWARFLKMPLYTLQSRIRYGFSGEKLFAPQMKRKGE